MPRSQTAASQGARPADGDLPRRCRDPECRWQDPGGFVLVNFRSRALLDLAYELECTLRIPGVCEGGRGEPAHANWFYWGKGAGMKAHDFAFASACRACHMAIDQGSKLSGDMREGYWLRGHVETMRQLWERGLICVRSRAHVPPELERARATEAQTLGGNATHSQDGTLPQRKRRGSKRGTHCVRPDKVLPRGNRIV